MTFVLDVQGAPGASVLVDDQLLHHGDSFELTGGRAAVTPMRVKVPMDIVDDAFSADPREVLYTCPGGTADVVVDYAPEPAAGLVMQLGATSVSGWDRGAVAEQRPATFGLLIGSENRAIAFGPDGTMLLVTPGALSGHHPANLDNEDPLINEGDWGIAMSDARFVSVAGDGTMWVSAGDELVPVTAVRVGREEMVTKGTPVSVPEVAGARGTAFDTDGNLWVASDAGLVRLTAGTLAPDIVITAKTQAGAPLADPTGLAFDADGALWVTYPGATLLVRFAPGQLAASGDLVPVESRTPAVTASLGALAFDNAGGLWLADDGGPVRIDVTTGAHTKLPSTLLEGHGIVVNPAPDDLPIND